MKEALESMLKTFHLEGKMNEFKLIESWEKIMGPSVANRTTGIKIINKKLYINLNSASLREELFLARQKIASMLNEAAGTEVITEVVFQ